MSAKLVLVIVCALLAVAPSHALLPCVKQWKNASAHHDWSKCDWSNWPLSYYFQASGVILFSLVFAATFIVCPCVLIARYCCRCCGSFRRRPGYDCCGGSEWDSRTTAEINAGYTVREVRAAHRTAYAAAIIGVVAFVVMIHGSLHFSHAVEGDVDSLFNVVETLQGKFAHLKTAVTLESSGNATTHPTFVPPITDANLTKFTDKINDVHHVVREIKHYVSKYKGRFIVAVGFCVAIPTLLLLLSTIPACCNIRTCVPLCFTLLFFLTLMVLSVFGIVLGAVQLGVHETCSEFDAQWTKSRGIFQLYLVPKCQHDKPFGSINASVFDAVVRTEKRACASMLRTKLLDNFAFPMGDCDVNTVQRFLNDSRSSTALPDPGACSDAGGHLYHCTVYECSTHCVNDELKTLAMAAVNKTLLFDRVNRAYAADVKPLQDCNYLYNESIAVFRDNNRCHRLLRGLDYQVGAIALYSAAFIVGIVAMLRGQKRFFSKDRVTMGVVQCAEGQYQNYGAVPKEDPLLAH